MDKDLEPRPTCQGQKTQSQNQEHPNATTLYLKNRHTWLCNYLCRLLTDFLNSFTDALSTLLAIKRSLSIPPHLNCVATIPCETQIVKNHKNQ